MSIGNTNPLVSILMPMFNAAEHVGQTIASLQAQTYSNWELIAIDDGSSDASYQVVAAINDRRIRLMGERVNRGLPARLNQAIRHANGALFARMDADDIAFATRLQTQVAYLLANPLIDVVATDMLVVDLEGSPRGRERWRGASHESVTASPWSGFHFNHGTWMGRAGWFRRHGYREDATRTEDDDLMLRSYQTSRFHRLDRVMYAYRLGPTSARAIWVARSSFIRSLWREARVQRDPRLLYGIWSELAKGAAERVAEMFGLTRLVSGHRCEGEVAHEDRLAYEATLAALS
ncbi:MAG: glycosyltransferase involved in cell wall biosynthesis [Rhodothermales bacterium]|jgi:glycosyltransferase involved in cell wall biosynthesis